MVLVLEFDLRVNRISLLDLGMDGWVARQRGESRREAREAVHHGFGSPRALALAEYQVVLISVRIRRRQRLTSALPFLKT